MATPETAVLFKQGLEILNRAPDYATLRDTIQKMLAITSPDDIFIARDAIAKILRQKQAVELKAYEAYPQTIAELDQKYRDLSIYLKQATSNQQSLQGIEPNIQAPAPLPTQNTTTGIVKLGPLAVPAVVVDWIKSKKTALLAGTAAITTVSGAYFLYNKMFGEAPKKENPEKESSFDKTIKSIQKYRLFSQLAKDPNLTPGDFAEILDGKIDKKKKVIKKKETESPQKSDEWDYEEKSLMKNMDSAFHALSMRPKLNYTLPELPAPTNNINVKALVSNDKENSTEIEVFTPKKKRKKRRTKVEMAENEGSSETGTTEEESFESSEEKIEKPARKPEREVTGGRLIPIVKRTKRIKKVNA